MIGSPGVSTRWMDAQKAMPSFLPADSLPAGGAGASQVANALDAPLPSSLMTRTEAAASPGSVQRGRRGRALSASPGASHTARSPVSLPPRTLPIHDDLLQKGRLYDQRREALQERAIHRELSQCRQVPKVSKMGHNIIRNSDIVTRLLNVYAEKKNIHRFKMAQIEKKEEETVGEWFQPKISRRGRRSQGKTNNKSHELWAFKRAEKLEEFRRQCIIREMEHVQETPEINPRSEALAAKRREREGLSGYDHIDAMIERDRLSKLARWEAQQQQMREEVTGTPRITALAATISNDEDVVERLYRRAQLRAEKLAEKERAIQQRESSGLFSPTITTTSHLLQQGVDYTPGSILERNSRKAQLTQERVEQLREEERMRHHPTIDPLSSAIAAQLPTSTEERLYQGGESPAARHTADRRPGSPASSRRLQAPGQSPSAHGGSPYLPAPTYHNAAASPSVKGGGSATPRAATPHDARHESWLQRMEAAEARRRQNLEVAAAAAQGREMQECTFAPRTSEGQPNRSPYPASSSHQHQHQHHHHPTSVYDREQQWAQRRDEKVEAIRRAAMRTELSDCTFSPQVGGRSALAAYDMAPPSQLYGGDGRAWGFRDHVSRLNTARRRDGDDDDDEGFGAGPGGAPRTPTQPLPFALSESNYHNRGRGGATPSSETRVPALAPPVSPAQPPSWMGAAGSSSAAHSPFPPSATYQPATTAAAHLMQAQAAQAALEARRRPLHPGGTPPTVTSNASFLGGGDAAEHIDDDDDATD